MNMTKQTGDSRNYGIDFLRVLSMFFVVLLHSLGHGGIINNAYVNTPQYKISWLMEIIAYCAVDIFGLISGYVAYSDTEKKSNYANYGVLWLEVVFYGVLITAIFNLINVVPISIKDYVIVLYPVTGGLYWYFTAYTGLFIFMPIINKAIRNTDEKALKRFLIVLFFVFSVFDTITKRFYLDDGYSFLWLLLLYIMGAIIKKCQIGKEIKYYKIYLGIICLTTIAYSYKIYGFNLAVHDLKITNDLFVSYTAPTILLIAILYLIFFSRVQFNDTGKKIIKFITPSAFAVYLINNHRLVWKHVMYNLFACIANESIIKIIFYPIAFSFMFVIAVILIDKIRQYIFRRLKIKTIMESFFKKVLKI